MGAYNVASIQTLPVHRWRDARMAPYAMLWARATYPCLDLERIRHVVKEAQHPKISFSFQVEGASAAVKVGFSEGDYTTAYDATFQLLRHLEERFGEETEGLLL